MAILDDELQADLQEDARAIAYIREHLPAELLPTFTPAVLQEVIDAAVDYLSTSPSLDLEADDEGYIDINVEAMAQALLPHIHVAEGLSPLLSSDVETVLSLWMDTEEAFAE